MIRLHNVHARSLIRRDDDSAIIIGVAGGRVNGRGLNAKWLYSLRLFLLVFRVEVLWKTGRERTER